MSGGPSNFGHNRRNSTMSQTLRRGSVVSQRHVGSGGRRAEDDHISPLHDPAGKPLRRHGTETFGDIIMHPIKELHMHHKRSEAYQAEKESWDEKQEHLNTSSPLDGQAVRVRLTVHFRHLVGEQLFNFTEGQIKSLAGPLRLTSKEEEELKLLHDTDDFIDFLEETKRDFSVKVHKTVKLKNFAPKSEKSSLELDSSAETIVSPQKPYPHKIQSSSDLVFDLNKNIYLQIQFIPIVVHHEASGTRKAIFSIPDPDLSDEVDEETSATWIELLGDVFYVGWLSQFTHSVEIDSMATLNIYAAWFVVMWWTWCSSALYSSRYDKQDVAHHIYKIIELCGLIIMAGSSEKAKFLSPKWFIIGYIIMKAVQLFQYLVIFIVSLGAHFKSSRQPLGMYVATSALSIALWGVSLLYTSEADKSKRYALWYTSICLEVVVHVLLQGNSRVTLKASHLGERFGLFTLIILGENCMGFIKMVAENASTSSIIACNVFGVTIIFCYFFMYFDDFSGEFMRESKLNQLWMYLHFPLHLFQVAFGIALTAIISHHGQGRDTAAGMAEEETSCSYEESCEADPVFSIKLFWIAGGLILCFNAFIKLVNTPVHRGSYKAYIICSSRILNAIVFFSLSTITYANMNGLGMVSVMMACLLFQSVVDLLD